MREWHYYRRRPGPVLLQVDTHTHALLETDAYVIYGVLQSLRSAHTVMSGYKSSTVASAYNISTDIKASVIKAANRKLLHPKGC